MRFPLSKKNLPKSKKVADGADKRFDAIFAELRRLKACNSENENTISILKRDFNRIERKQNRDAEASFTLPVKETAVESLATEELKRMGFL